MGVFSFALQNESRHKTDARKSYLTVTGGFEMSLSETDCRRHRDNLSHAQAMGQGDPLPDFGIDVKTLYCI
jgi:hypothetical protein